MKENDLQLTSGWAALVMILITPFILAALVISLHPVLIGVAGLGAVVWVVSMFGFLVNSPNEAKVVQLFGEYVGTVKQTGFFYGNPLYSKKKVSMRVQIFETGMNEVTEKKDAAGNVTQAGSKSRQPSKVNDRDGTPIEIAAVVSYMVTNTAEACFKVDDYHAFVQINADAALRSLASRYSYDADDAAHSLRGHITEVAEKLQHEIAERTKIAGVEIAGARISYLAYAPEIASAMLQRQQAGALIAARQRIVEGAVGMVEHALEMLSARKVVELDDDRKAAMVSNLLVVLCGHTAPAPVINAGTIHQ